MNTGSDGVNRIVACLEDIPSSWSVTKLKYAMQKIGSGTTPSTDVYQYYAGVIPWIQSGDLYGIDEVKNTEKTLSESAVEDYSALRVYDAPFVVLAMYGASAGNSAISRISSAVNQACCVLIPDSSNSLRFIRYWLENSKDALVSASRGGGQPNLSQELIKNWVYAAPNLKQQQLIADYIDSKTAEIDGLVEKLQREVELLERYRRELIARTVTRGLNPDVPLRDSGIEWIGKIPEHWVVERLQWHASQVSVDNDPFVTDQILSLVKDVGVMPFEERGLKGNKAKTDLSAYKVAFPGTIVLNSMNVIIGSVGISNYLGLVSPVYYVFKNKPNTSLGFLNYVFRTRAFQKELRKYANGILEIRLRVSTSAVLKRMLAFPPLEEQRAIVDYLDQKMSEIDSTVSGIRKQVELLGKYRKQVINDLVTGKVRVGEMV